MTKATIQEIHSRKGGIILKKARTNLKQGFLFMFLVGVVTVFNVINVGATTGANKNARNVEITREITLTDVEEFAKLENEINSIQGGVILQNNGNSYSSHYTLLIPRNNFEQNLEKILSYGTVKSDTRNQTDITNEVTILEKSIASNEKHKEIIISLIEKSKTIDSIIEFEQYLVDVEIEQTNSQNELLGLMNLSNYTTLNLNIAKTEDVTAYVEDSFMSRVGEAFADSTTNTLAFFEDIIIAVSYVFIPIVFVIIIITVLIRLRKRGKNNEDK